MKPARPAASGPLTDMQQAAEDLNAPAQVAPERRTMGLPIFVEGHQLHPDEAAVTPR
jgi:hypothetical protein